MHNSFPIFTLWPPTQNINTPVPGTFTDGTEISEAGWFAADDLPKIPPKLSIAGSLIDWFVENHSKAR